VWAPPSAAPYPATGYGPPPGWAYVAPTHATRLGRVPAGFGERLGALILDTLILFAVALPVVLLGVLFVAADWETYDSVCTDERGLPYECTQLSDGTALRLGLAIVLGIVVMITVSIFYWGHFEGRRGATPGKRALGIEVVRQDTGEPIGFGRAVGRMFARWLSGQVLYLGYLWMLWDDNKQTWHDKIVSSIVVKAQQ
jgi:uncharacterized RDD family membrane protein YckC